jgi:hypothetical protein
MGKVICPKHGRQLFAFVSARIAAQAKDGAEVTAEPIYAMKLRWLGLLFVCPVHADFLAQNSLGVPTSSRIVPVDDEDRSQELLAKLSGSCRVCLGDHLRSRPECIDVARAVDEQFEC